jgi:uncharacterized protein YkwD
MQRLPVLLLGAIILCPATLAAEKESSEKLKLTKEEQAVVKLTNDLRAKEKLPPLKVNALLTQAARAHSRNMAKQQKLEHVLDEKEPADRVKETGYQRALVAENIAGGRRLPPSGAFELWVDSKPHRANLLGEKFEEIGVGVARDDKGEVYYTQVFGTPRKSSSEGGEPGEDSDFDEARAEILKRTNEARAKEKLPPLKMNPLLTKIANAHSANMAKQEKMAHVLDGKKPAQRVKEGGYDYADTAENVATSEDLDAAEVMEMWVKSETHRDNILGEPFREIGIGLARSAKGDVYYTQVFGTPRKKK